jgi:itaconate CoA-transferase
VLISIQSEREWRIFSKGVLGAADMADDVRFASNVARVRHRAQTDAAVAAAFGVLPADVLIARLTNAEIAFAELNDMAALSHHPHLRRIEVNTQAGPVSLPAPAVILRGGARTYGAVPGLGEHTAAVLTKFALDEGQAAE